MTEKNKKEEEKNGKVVEFETSSGLKVKLDPSRATTRLLVKARTVTGGGFDTSPFILSEICLFNGEKLNMDEVMDNIDTLDFIEIEQRWADEKKRKKSQSQTPTI